MFTLCTMKLDHGRWPGPTSMVRFLKKSIQKAVGPPTRCKLNVDQEEWSCTRKTIVLNFFIYICPKMIVWKKKIKLDHSLVFNFSSPIKYSLNFYYSNISLPWAFFYSSISFTSPSAKHVGPSMDNVGLKICLLRSLDSMVTLMFLPWCKPKWSQDEFSNESQIFTRPWDKFMVHGVNNP